MYDKLHNLYRQMKHASFTKYRQAAHTSALIQDAFRAYLDVDDAFYPSHFIFGLNEDSGEQSGFSYVEIYAYKKDKDHPDPGVETRIVNNFEYINITDSLYQRLPIEIRKEIPQLLNVIDIDAGTKFRNLLDSLEDQSLIKDIEKYFAKCPSSFELLYDSPLEKGYFIFDLSITFPKNPHEYPKNRIQVKLGLKIHQSNIVELAIFDSKNKFESVVFEPGDKLFFSFFRTKLMGRDLKKLIEITNFMSRTCAMEGQTIGLFSFIQNKPEYQQLYTLKKESISKMLDGNGDFIPENDRKTIEIEYPVFSAEDMPTWEQLIDSEEFKKKAILMPDDVLRRILLRYEWCLENYKPTNGRMPKKDQPSVMRNINCAVYQHSFHQQGDYNALAVGDKSKVKQSGNRWFDQASRMCNSIFGFEIPVKYIICLSIAGFIGFEGHKFLAFIHFSGS